MAALDNDGQTLCNANLELAVDGTKVSGIKKSSAYSNDYATYDPDYTASKTSGVEGKYKIILTNLDTKEAVETNIIVGLNPPFEIKRSGATRINSSLANRYPMIIFITAKEDYKGKIKEQIPQLTLLDPSQSTIEMWKVLGK